MNLSHGKYLIAAACLSGALSVGAPQAAANDTELRHSGEFSNEPQRTVVQTTVVDGFGTEREKRSIQVELVISDGQGRVRRESNGVVVLQVLGKAQPIVLYPASKTFVDPNGKTPEPTRPTLFGREVSPEFIEEAKRAVERSNSSSGASRSTTVAVSSKTLETKDLGVKTISGTEVRGTASTIEVPAVDGFNKRPYTIASEAWRDDDGRIVQMSSANSLSGQVTIRDLQHNDGARITPDLFEVPADYRPMTGR